VKYVKNSIFGSAVTISLFPTSIDLHTSVFVVRCSRPTDENKKNVATQS